MPSLTKLFVLMRYGDIKILKCHPSNVREHTESHRMNPGVWKVLRHKNPYIFKNGAWSKKTKADATNHPPFKCDLISYVRMRLRLNHNWAVRALVRLYELQTQTEKNRRCTVESNGKGFDALDAPIFTQYVMQLRRRIPLTKEQLELLHLRIHRYAEQVYTMSDKEALKASLDKYYAKQSPVDPVLAPTP